MIYECYYSGWGRIEMEMSLQLSLIYSMTSLAGCVQR